MDLMTGFISITVAAISATIIYFISVSSMKEKTYDEVKAEQKMRAEEFLAQGRSAKEKAKDKKLKKIGKKVREKKADELVTFEDMQNVNSDPKVLSNTNTSIEEANLKEEEEIKSKLTIQRQKSSQVSRVHINSQAEPNIEKSQTHKHLPISQKTSEKNMNLAQSSDIQPFTKAQENTVLKPSVEEVKKVYEKPIQSSPSAMEIDNATRNSRKKRSDLLTLQQMSGEREGVNVNLLIPLVHKTELSRTEIQVLIDLLLNKQQGSSVDSAEWTEGKQDPIVKLKKQLAEKEKALTEEKEAACALQSKLRDLRSELNVEKHLTRQLEENLQVRQAEVGALNGRVQQLADEKQTLMQQIQQLQGKLKEEHMLLCKLQEDQGQTQNAMQQELLTQRQQLEMHIARLTEQHQETIGTLEAQIGQIASQLQEQEAVNSSLSAELAVIQEREVRLQDSAVQSQDLARQVKELHSEIERLRSKSQYDSSRLQNEVTSMTEQLNLKRAEIDKLSSLLKNVQTENNCLSHQISSAYVEAQQLRDENESLAAQVTASMERPATEGRENGDVVYESKHININLEKNHEKEALIEQLKYDILSKENELNLLKPDLLQKESLIKSLKTELDLSQINIEKVLKEVATFKCLVQEQESIINALRKEGDSAHMLVKTLQEENNTNKAEIVQLSKECATREQVQSRESIIEKLTSEINTYKTKIVDQEYCIQSLQQELNAYKTNVPSIMKIEMLIGELNTHKTELMEKESEIKSLSTLIFNYQEDIKQLRSELLSSKESVNKMTKEIEDYGIKQTSLNQEVEAHKRKNNELRSKNWKVMDALKTTEKCLETKMKQLQCISTNTEENVRLKEQERTKQLLQTILPQISVDSKQVYDVWLEHFMKQACQKSSVGNVGVLAEVEQQNSQLQTMVTHYKAIIADTEGMLNRLQSHVEQEEDRWGQKIQALESQLEAVIQERDRLEADGKNKLFMVDDGCSKN